MAKKPAAELKSNSYGLFASGDEWKKVALSLHKRGLAAAAIAKQVGQPAGVVEPLLAKEAKR